MAFVLDASVTAAWMLPDEEDSLAEQVHALIIAEKAVVPMVWWVETRNLVLTAERRGRLSRDQADIALSALEDYDPVIDSEFAHAATVALARKHHLTIYDATYVELAARTGLRLATLDRQMARAARAEGVDLVISAA